MGKTTAMKSTSNANAPTIATTTTDASAVLLTHQYTQRQAALNTLTEFRNIIIWRYTLRHWLYRLWQNIQYFILLPLCCFSGVAYFSHPDFQLWVNGKIRSLVNFNLVTWNADYTNLTLEGNVYTDREEVMEIIGMVLHENNYGKDLTILSKLRQAILTLPWVKDVELYQTLALSGNNIHVILHEKIPEFLWINQNSAAIVLKNGDIIHDFSLENFQGMVQIISDNIDAEIMQLWELVSLNETLFPLLEQIEHIQGRRFNLLLRNGTVVKLPMKGYQDAVGFLVKCLQNQGMFYHLKTMDLRIPNKVFLEYDKNTIAEVQRYLKTKAK